MSIDFQLVCAYNTRCLTRKKRKIQVLNTIKILKWSQALYQFGSEVADAHAGAT